MRRLSRSLLVWLLLLACGRTSAPPAAPKVAAGSAPAVATGRSSELASQLDHVRPPPMPCLPGERPVSALLVARAAEEFERGRYDRVIVCTQEALEQEPRSVAAHHYRAASLAATDRLDEARLAYARALAIDPNDPETLLGASDLYVLKLGDERQALELGVEYALRGARFALLQKRRGRDLTADLLVMAGLGENDLGRSRSALRHFERVLTTRPGDVDAQYGRGAALYELCRFVEAERAFKKVLEKSPNDAWAVQYLGLLAERAGDDAGAKAFLRRASELSPADFGSMLELDRPAFERKVKDAIAGLPLEERRTLDRVPIEIEELPRLADLTAVDPPLSPSILGLYRGPPADDSSDSKDGSCSRSIVLYRKNLLRLARDEKELSAQVKVTLLHELGHLHGESDEHLRDRGLE